MFRREPDTGSTLTRRDESAPSPVPGLLAGIMRLRKSFLCSSGSATTGWVVGGSGMEAGVTVAGPRLGCGNTKARECRREAAPIWLRERTVPGDALTAATAGAGTTTSALDGPPIARTDSVTLAPGESNSRRKFTSLFLGQYVTLPSLNCFESSSNLCSCCPSLIHRTALPAWPDDCRSQDNRRLLPALVTFKASDRPGLAA